MFKYENKKYKIKYKKRKKRKGMGDGKGMARGSKHCRQLPKGRQLAKFITSAMSTSPLLKAFKMQINQRQMTNCE